MTTVCPVCGEEIILYIDRGDPSVGLMGGGLESIEGDCPHVDGMNNLILDDRFDSSWVGHQITYAAARINRLEAEAEAAYYEEEMKYEAEYARLEAERYDRYQEREEQLWRR